MECMPHMGVPISMVLMPVLLAVMGPIVEPQAESFLTTNYWMGTSAFLATAFRREEETRSVAYLWL